MVLDIQASKYVRSIKDDTNFQKEPETSPFHYYLSVSQSHPSKGWWLSSALLATTAVILM